MEAIVKQYHLGRGRYQLGAWLYYTDEERERKGYASIAPEWFPLMNQRGAWDLYESREALTRHLKRALYRYGYSEPSKINYDHRRGR